MNKGKQKIGSIIRLDKPKDDMTKGTHGWQVRVPTGQPKNYYSKLFSDNVYGSKGKALVAAEEHLEEYLETHSITIRRSNIPYFRTLAARNKSGKTGVYRTHSFHSGTGLKQEFWGVHCSIGPYGRPWSKQFYISTHGEEEAKRLAIEFREMWEQAVDKGEKALREFFEEYHSGWL